MKSMPNFEVDIAKDDGRTLSFSCSYLSPDEETPSSPEEQFDDVFAIDEVTMFDGEEWSEKKYAVAGDILDGNLYDLFMGKVCHKVLFQGIISIYSLLKISDNDN